MRRNWKQICAAGAILAVVGVSGCAMTTQPFEYHDDRNEKPGPGLFSGEKGGFVIYGGHAGDRTDREDTAAGEE